MFLLLFSLSVNFSAVNYYNFLRLDYMTKDQWSNNGNIVANVGGRAAGCTNSNIVDDCLGDSKGTRRELSWDQCQCRSTQWSQARR